MRENGAVLDMSPLGLKGGPSHALSRAAHGGAGGQALAGRCVRDGAWGASPVR